MSFFFKLNDEQRRGKRDDFSKSRERTPNFSTDEISNFMSRDWFDLVERNIILRMQTIATSQMSTEPNGRIEKVGDVAVRSFLSVRSKRISWFGGPERRDICDVKDLKYEYGGYNVLFTDISRVGDVREFSTEKISPRRKTKDREPNKITRTTSEVKQRAIIVDTRVRTRKL